MVSHRNLIVSMIQVAVAAESDGPNPMFEVRSRVDLRLRLLPALSFHGIEPADRSDATTRHAWIPAHVPHLRSALLVYPPGLVGGPDYHHPEVERRHRP